LKNLILIFSKKILLLLFIVSGILIQSCNKKPEQIGEGIQPDKDLITLKFSDTSGIVAYSIREDSVRTDKPEHSMLGSIKDPVFGTTVASFYTQIRLSNSNHDFGENPQLDSLVLQLAYSGYYGDTTTAQTIRVYELAEAIYYDSAYYSHDVKDFGSLDYAAYTFVPKPKTTYKWQGDTLSPLIRMRLDHLSPSLGEKLLSASETHLSANDKFVEYFRGIYVTADPVSENGAVLNFNLPSVLSGLTIYYSNDEQDSLRFEFTITSSDARFNRFDHSDYQDADPDLKNQLLNGDTLLGRNKLYVQAMGGIKTKLFFPNLTRFAAQQGGKIVVNEAKLIFTGRSIDTLLYFPPSQLALVKVKEDGSYSLLSDQLEGDNYFGGSYLPLSNQFQFRLTRYVQDLILNGGDEDYGLYVFISGASSRANRWVMNGIQPDNDTLSPLRLELNYSLVRD
jgi:hypothetical protein